MPNKKINPIKHFPLWLWQLATISISIEYIMLFTNFERSKTLEFFSLFFFLVFQTSPSVFFFCWTYISSFLFQDTFHTHETNQNTRVEMHKSHD